MARKEKIDTCLRTLETEFRTLLSREVQKVAHGSCSRYLMRKIPQHADGKFWRDEDAGHMEYLEKEIRSICEKSGDSSYVIRLVDDYISKVTVDSSQGRNLARQLLPRL